MPEPRVACAARCYCAVGSVTRPKNRMLPVAWSRMRNTNGRSICAWLRRRWHPTRSHPDDRRGGGFRALLVHVHERLMDHETDVELPSGRHPGEVGTGERECLLHAHRDQRVSGRLMPRVCEMIISIVIVSFRPDRLSCLVSFAQMTAGSVHLTACRRLGNDGVALFWCQDHR